MRSQPDRPKSERLAEFLSRLGSAPAANSFDEAYEQLCAVLNDVENSMTSIPFNTDRWQTDGRMYPPQADSIREVESHPKVKRFRSLKHNTYIGDNGAFEIRSAREGEIILTKPGADGKGVWEQ